MTAAPNACQACEEIGGDGHLGKPFGIDELVWTVSRLAQEG